MDMSRRRTAKALAAVTAVSIALVTAGPAGAESKDPTPPVKKGCEVQLKGPGAGQSIVYPHGYSFSVSGQDNKTHTYTCNDGTWKETVSLTAPPSTVGSVALPIVTGGTLQVLTTG
jgi:hypothetical protein